MLQKLCLTGMSVLCFISSYSQATDTTKKMMAPADTAAKAAPPADTTKPATAGPVAITGSIDVYYRANSGSGGSKYTNNYTSFTNSVNSFELGMASIRADH